jgi:hypothetical protein
MPATSVKTPVITSGPLTVQILRRRLRRFLTYGELAGQSGEEGPNECRKVRTGELQLGSRRLADVSLLPALVGLEDS